MRSCVRERKGVVFRIDMWSVAVKSHLLGSRQRYSRFRELQAKHTHSALAMALLGTRAQQVQRPGTCASARPRATLDDAKRSCRNVS